jgi:hypothetical protein
VLVATQALTVNARKNVVAGLATASYAGQAIRVNAMKIIAAAVATILVTPRSLIVNAGRRASVAVATVVLAGQTIHSVSSTLLIRAWRVIRVGMGIGM